MQISHVVAAYNKLDSRIVHLYEDVVAGVQGFDKAKEALEALAGIQKSEDLRKLVKRVNGRNAEGQAWNMVKRFFGESLHDLLLGDKAVLEKIREFASDAKNFLEEESSKKLRDLIKHVKNASKLELLFQELQESRYDTPARFRENANNRTRGLVEGIIGKAFDEIEDSDLGDGLEALHKAIDKIRKFKKESYEKILSDAVSQSFSMELGNV